MKAKTTFDINYRYDLSRDCSCRYSITVFGAVTGRNLASERSSRKGRTCFTHWIETYPIRTGNSGWSAGSESPSLRPYTVQNRFFGIILHMKTTSCLSFQDLLTFFGYSMHICKEYITRTRNAAVESRVSGEGGRNSWTMFAHPLPDPSPRPEHSPHINGYEARGFFSIHASIRAGILPQRSKCACAGKV